MTSQRGGFRTKEQKERDKSFIAGLYVKNYGLAEIADRLAEYVREEGDDYRLTPQQIWYDCKKIMIEWKRTRLKEIDDWVEIELKKLDRIENELWIAWEKSKATKRKTKFDGGNVSGGQISGGTLKERTLEETNGDPRYLDLIMGVMDKRAKLLGYNAPMKVEISRPKDEEDRTEKRLEDLPEDLVMQLADSLSGIKRLAPSKN